jgi:ADP-heptose:LPS heptosyltransferase
VKLYRAHFRDSTHYAAAVASEIAAPILQVVARAMSRSAPTPPDRWRNGVILGNGHIGDVLYRTCSLGLLSRGLPNCEWAYLTTSSAAAVLDDNPAISQILPWLDEADAVSIKRSRTVEFASQRFDVALCSENVTRHRTLIMATRYGIPNRVGFVGKGLSGLVTEGIHLSERMSHPAAFRQMVERITNTTDTSPLRPHIYPSVADMQAAQQECGRLAIAGNNMVIASAVTTRQTIGDFPPDFFVTILCRVLEMAPDARVVLTGLADERPVLESIAERLGARAAVSAGSLSVRAYAAFLRHCAAFLGADSGPRHIANAADIPVFFVRNMGATEIGSGAYCPTEVDIAPRGEYLSAAAMRRALETVDCDAVAAAVVTAARQQARDKRGDIEN